MNHKNPFPETYIIDDVAPEDVAMMQALYSRSSESSKAHLEKIRQIGSGKFMSSYYVGYGHKSIADCGTTTAFIENVSLLAAKAIQDWPLYCGQETSTRYIDMSTRDIVDPVGSAESGLILDQWMSFYRSNYSRVLDTVRIKYPKGETEDLVNYERAVQARTFDIMRGFLPAGITTQLSWHTNLRQAGDHLSGMKHHPSQEIRSLASRLLAALHEKYPSSGFASETAAVSGVGSKDSGQDERVNWDKKMAQKYAYQPSMYLKPTDKERMMMGIMGPIVDEISDFLEDINSRPRGCILPHFMADFGQVTWSFYLDFGSFRDIQRHRNGVCRMPLLTTEHGFEPWYLEELDEDLRAEATQLLSDQESKISSISADPVIRQYYTALGYRVPTEITYGLPAAIYVMELRSGKAIHPTLRRRVHQMIKSFQLRLPEVKLHVDLDPSDWDVRRGSQTITAK